MFTAPYILLSTRQVQTSFAFIRINVSAPAFEHFLNSVRIDTCIMYFLSQCFFLFPSQFGGGGCCGCNFLGSLTFNCVILISFQLFMMLFSPSLFLFFSMFRHTYVLFHNSLSSAKYWIWKHWLFLSWKKTLQTPIYVCM